MQQFFGLTLPQWNVLVTLMGLDGNYFHQISAAQASIILTVKTDGTWTVTKAAGGTLSGSPTSGVWRIDGAGADFEVLFTVTNETNSPVVVNDASSFTSLSSDRLVSISKNSNDASADVDVKIRRIGTTAPVLNDSTLMEANGAL